MTVTAVEIQQMKGLGEFVLGCIAGGLLSAAAFFAVEGLMPSAADAHELDDQSAVVHLWGDTKTKNGKTVLYGCSVDHEKGDRYAEVTCHY